MAEHRAFGATQLVFAILNNVNASEDACSVLNNLHAPLTRGCTLAGRLFQTEYSFAAENRYAAYAGELRKKLALYKSEVMGNLEFSL